MRNVVVQRVVITDTVEDRILAMQERKVGLSYLFRLRHLFIPFFKKTFADGALGEGSGKKMGSKSNRPCG